MRRAAKVDAIGQRYGMLIVTGYQPGTHTTKPKGVVRCDCGTEKTVVIDAMRRGLVVSCGCAKRERIIAYSTKHGAYATPEHNSWAGMKERCNNPKAHNFHWYGAKGVRVCARWNENFADFLADMGPKGFV